MCHIVKTIFKKVVFLILPFMSLLMIRKGVECSPNKFSYAFSMKYIYMSSLWSAVGAYVCKVVKLEPLVFITLPCHNVMSKVKSKIFSFSP